MSIHQIIVACDGACQNPGPGGWGVIIKLPNDKTIKFGGCAADTTNNQMEVMALIEALRRIDKLQTSKPSLQSAHVIIQLDSQYAINGALKPAQRKKNIDLWNIYDRTSKPQSLTFEKIESHSRHALNEQADQLAKQHCNQAKQPQHDRYPRYLGLFADGSFSPSTTTLPAKKQQKACPAQELKK